MKLGADVEELRHSARGFWHTASELGSASFQTRTSAGMVSYRMIAVRNQIDAVADSLQRHSHRIQELSVELNQQALDQENVSRVSGGPAFSVKNRPSALVRGIPRPPVVRKPLGGPVLRGVRRTPVGHFGQVLGSNAAALSATWNQTSKSLNVGRNAIEIGQSLERSRRFAPRAPRTLRGLKNLVMQGDVKKLKEAFKTRTPSAATRAKHLKNVKAARFGMGANVLSLLPGRSGELFGHVASVAGGLDDLKKIAGVKGLLDKKPLKLIPKLTKSAATTARISGVLAVASGAFGLYDTYKKYRAGEISKGIAVRDGATNAAMVVGGALMLIPGGQLIGGAIVLGAATAQAAAWLYDRPQISAAASKAARIATQAASKGIQQVAKAVPAPVRALGAAMADGAKKAWKKIWKR